MTTFYDEQMNEMVQSVITYLLSERGQRETAEAAKRSEEFAALLKLTRDIPWEKLHETVHDLSP